MKNHYGFLGNSGFFPAKPACAKAGKTYAQSYACPASFDANALATVWVLEGKGNPSIFTQLSAITLGGVYQQTPVPLAP